MIEKFSNPIQTHDLFGSKMDVGNFAVAQKLINIRVQAMSIAKQADDKLTEDGEFAKVYAESIANWLVEIACVANQALEQVVMVNADVIPAKLVPPPPKENLLVI